MGVNNKVYNEIKELLIRSQYEFKNHIDPTTMTATQFEVRKHDAVNRYLVDPVFRAQVDKTTMNILQIVENNS